MKRLKKIQFCAIFFCFPLFLAQWASAQSINLGIPPIRNFPKKTYQAGTQNWDAAQDRRGVLFFANNEGLLQFDGNRWACYPVANKTVLRSVAVDSSGRIYVGAQSELGYFFPAKNGQLRYHSLVRLLPTEARNFEDVWDIEIVSGSVFFRSQRSVFQLAADKIQVHEPGGELSALFATPQGLLLQRNTSEILVFKDGSFHPFLQSQQLTSGLTGAMPWQGDTLLFSTLKNGLFCLAGGQFMRWQTASDALLLEKKIYDATIMPNGHLALATSLDGLIEIDKHRRVFRHLNKKCGLQNNNVLHVFADRAGNLWLGLDSGIDCAIIPSPFTSIIPDGDLQGTGYAAAIFENQLYLGVSNGVYHTAWLPYIDPEKKPLFEKIIPTDGQVWGLGVIGGTLLLGHHEGTFQLQGRKCSRISSEAGAWTFVQLNDEWMISGNYAGLFLYRKSGNTWVFEQKIPGLNESCRFMVKDADGSVWVAHPYRGLYRIEQPIGNKTLQVDFFNSKNGLPSDLNNFVFSIAGKAVFATEKGIFRFNAARSVFEPDVNFEGYLGKGKRIKYLREDASGNIWYVGDQEVGRLDVTDFGLKKEVKKRVFPELAGKLVSGFEFIFPADASNVFLGAEQGFIRFDAAAPGSPDTALQLVLSEVSVSGTRDSVIFGGFFLDGDRVALAQGPEQQPVLSADLNHLRFLFSAIHFDDPALLEYRYKLEGLDHAWSDWSKENVRNFTNLNPGKYRFAVQARLRNGRESAVLEFAFRIKSPWYANTAAFVLYAAAFFGAFVVFLVRQKRRFESDKESLTVQHRQITAQQQREVEKSKAALGNVLREKLEAEIQFKNKELAAATMHLVQKGEILQTVRENLNQILEKSGSLGVKKDIQQLLNLLQFDANLDEDWEHFAVHFDQVHVDFLQRLRERHPQLNSTDHRLCAYLRMNLTSKEIAPLMNISVRGVEACRYRLRKKLGLPNDANLVEAIAGL